MADDNRHGEMLARKHEEEIEQLFFIVNEQAEQIYQLRVILHEAGLADAPEPLEKAPSKEELEAQKAEAEKAAKREALKKQLEELDAPSVKKLTPVKEQNPLAIQNAKQVEMLAKRKALLKKGGDNAENPK